MGCGEALSVSPSDGVGGCRRRRARGKTEDKGPGMKESNLESKPERRPTRTYCGVTSTLLGPSGWVAKQASPACGP